MEGDPRCYMCGRSSEEVYDAWFSSASNELQTKLDESISKLETLEQKNAETLNAWRSMTESVRQLPDSIRKMKVGTIQADTAAFIALNPDVSYALKLINSGIPVSSSNTIDEVVEIAANRGPALVDTSNLQHQLNSSKYAMADLESKGKPDSRLIWEINVPVHRIATDNSDSNWIGFQTGIMQMMSSKGITFEVARKVLSIINDISSRLPARRPANEREANILWENAVQDTDIPDDIKPLIDRSQTGFATYSKKYIAESEATITRSKLFPAPNTLRTHLCVVCDTLIKSHS